MKIEVDQTVQVFFTNASGTTALLDTAGDGVPVEELPLVVTAAPRVLCGGKVFEITEPGLYRFSVAPKTLQNVIVHDPDSPLPLLRSLSLLQVHGNRHQNEDEAGLLSVLRSDAYLSSTCGTIARAARKVLEEQGYSCRFVAGLTMEKWNAYDNGHTMFEVLWPGSGWVLVDLDMGFLFQENGKLLGLYEVRKCLQDGHKPEMINLADFRVDPFFYMDAYNFAPLCEWSWRSQEAIWKWYGRTLQSIAVLEDNKGYVYLGPKERVQEYCGDHTQVLDEELWIAKFYP